MPESIHERIDRERKALPDTANVRLYREYAEGKQRGTLSSEQIYFLRSLTGHDHADNVMDTVLATGASRVEFQGFEVGDDEVQQALDDVMVRNGLLDVQYDVHYPTLRDGNHALGLSWRDGASPMRADEGDDLSLPELPFGRVVVSQEPWWDGKQGVFVGYDEDGRTPVYAVKDWYAWMDLGGSMVKRQRRVIWYPDHIERYIRDGQGWVSFRLPGDPEEGQPINWEKRNGEPLGIPIIHFANGRFGKAPYGMSDLAGGLIGLQDEVNDLHRDITAAARLTAYQMYWMTGHDNSGKDKVTIGPGVLLWSSSKEARFGVLQAGSLKELIDGLLSKIQTIARNSATPQHLITGGDWPSGEALLRAESPLVDRSRRVIRSITPSWTTLGHRSTELINTFGRGTLDESKLIKAKFAPAERRDELTIQQIEGAKIDALLSLLELGFSKRAVLRKYGLTDEQITAMEAEIKREFELAGEMIPFARTDTAPDADVDAA